MAAPPTFASTAASSPGSKAITAAAADQIVAAAVAEVVVTLTPAGSTQAAATPLTGTVNVLTTGFVQNAGVGLPASSGRTILVINPDPASQAYVWPLGSAQIGAAGAGNPVAIAAGGRARFVQQSSTQWQVA